MQKMARLALMAAFLALQSSAAFAMSGSMSGSMMSSDSMKMAKCPTGDPAVIMNTTKKTYMMDTKANRDAMKGMMSHDKFICKSKAEKMGAKMAATHKMNKM